MNKLYMHISFDDVYRCFADLTNNADAYTSVYENPFLAKLKEFHDVYGACFSFYLFNTAIEDNYHINNVTDKFAKEFKEASSWLRMGFHAHEVETNYSRDTGIAGSYSTFCNAMSTKFGGTCAIDNFVRLGFCAGTSENVDKVINTENGITGLLAADDDRISYYMDESTNSKVINDCGAYDKEKDIIILRSQTRLELVESKDKLFSEFENTKPIGNIKILEVFTHEQEFDENVINLMEECLKWAKNNDYKFIFTEDITDDLKAELN